jgi:hypothetical protein
MAEICTSYTFIYFATNFSYNAFRSAYQMDHYLSKKKYCMDLRDVFLTLLLVYCQWQAVLQVSRVIIFEGRKETSY